MADSERCAGMREFSIVSATSYAAPISRCASRRFGLGAVWLVVAMGLSQPAAAQKPRYESLEAPLTPNLARQFFEEAKALSEEDGGRLWGVTLYGPMLFVDPKTRAVVANQADAEGRLEKEDDAFVGTLPPEEIIASTAMTWAGVKWTMLAWPIPKDVEERRHLMAHELWHRIQDDLALPASGFGNSHLNTRDGRIWMRLECRALRAALECSGQPRRRAILDALTFRVYRRSLFEKSEAQERALEMNEGLAEYTGIRLSSKRESAVAARAIKNLRSLEEWDTLARSFAYASGPAYGLLLDEAKPDWRKDLKAKDDLGRVLQLARSIAIPEDPAPQARKLAESYDGARLFTAEREREAARWQRLARYRKRLVYEPLLVIPLLHVNIGFNPLQIETLDDLGTVYPTATLSDEWGVLRVSGGVRLSKGWKAAYVPAPGETDARPLQGDGWTLELNEGWTLRPGERKGDFVVAEVNVRD